MADSYTGTWVKQISRTEGESAHVFRSGLPFKRLDSALWISEWQLPTLRKRVRIVRLCFINRIKSCSRFRQGTAVQANGPEAYTNAEVQSVIWNRRSGVPTIFKKAFAILAMSAYYASSGYSLSYPRDEAVDGYVAETKAV